MTRFAILPMLIAMACTLLAHSTVAAGQADDPESHYKELWSEPIPPKSKRRMVGRYRLPVFSELHRKIIRTNKTDKDAVLEDQIKLRFIQAGMSKIPKEHYRITCRNRLCEYVFIFKKHLTLAEEDSALSILAKVSGASCNPTSCQIGTVIGGNPKGGISTLGYFIPNDSGFL